MSGQFRFVRGTERAPDDGVAVVKSNLARRDAAHLRRDSVVNVITHHQETQQAVLRGGAKIDGLEENLI